ncbi:TetR family transcriptional regulator [Rhodopirellula sallentina SM41]|uniref:TetR family transcriptional regulator n=2 Tax=Rhodopirellula TaxID=265488 RepID=M5U933_9BACT|nr:TetR family transcriptional regulator [Rhodopirellula sallentina SM41]
MAPPQEKNTQDPADSDESTTASESNANSPAPADPSARLIAAAGPVFARRGFDRAPVREIAKIAGVNIAAINYYFGDKMGLYRAVLAGIRDRRQREYPVPIVGSAPPEETLGKLVRTLLSRMLASDNTGWEAMLMMREMQQPTTAMSEVVQEYFRPLHDAMCQTIAQLMAPLPVADSEPTRSWQENALVAQTALGVVGQCLHYLIGKPVIEQLVASEIREQHFDTESLCRHITASTLAACGRSDIVQIRQQIDSQTNNTPDTSTRPGDAIEATASPTTNNLTANRHTASGPKT